MNELKKHTDKIATSILRIEYADYDKNWWHYDREYNMLLKAQTEAFKLANDAAEQQDKEAIDTVVKEVCDHHWLPIGEWDGVMMMQCVKCNLYRDGEGKKECVHPYAMVYGGCGKPERCLLCGEILSD